MTPSPIPAASSPTEVRDCAILARAIRMQALRMVHAAQSSHIGSCLSMADLLAVLYTSILHMDPKQPRWEDRDRFILSKGHAAAILYAVLAERGFFPVEDLLSFCQTGSYFLGHVSHQVPGVEISTGSLGHGLPIGCGMALAAKRDLRRWRVFVMLSDGELDEGSNWEAILFAAHHQLDNLVAIVDYNRIQSFGTVEEVLRLEPLAEKWTAFGWKCHEVDGHDLEQIQKSFGQLEPGKPNVILAHTVKGKGVSFMEQKLLWHYRPPDSGQLNDALAEVSRADGLHPNP